MTDRMPSEPLPSRGWLVLALGPLTGPLGLGTWLRVLAGLAIVLLAVLTLQLGAIAVWLGFGAAPQRKQSSWPVRTVMFSVTYTLIIFVASPFAAERSGRTALPCFSGPLRPHSPLYCIAGRHYVDKQMAQSALAIASRVAGREQGAVIRYLDGGFPIGAGFPMLPHLTHGDGRRLDLALMWKHVDGTPARGNGSPVGYFGYARPSTGAASTCPEAWVDLRWDMKLLQPVLAYRRLDARRSRLLLEEVLAENSIRKVLLEPHVQRTLGASDGRLRFQGCRAARHDDHVHIQL